MISIMMLAAVKREEMSFDNDYDSSSEKMTAAENFNKARNRAFLSMIQNIITPDRDKLLSFHDVKEVLKPKGQSYKGLREVPLNLIIGSEGRSQDFTREFLPRKEFIRARWESVDRAQIGSITLPPVQLYEIGGAYFVRDGNHRVSVAISQGGEVIDAEVTSLDSEITIDPSMTTGDLHKAVIKFEKKLFCEKTSYEKLTGDVNLDFSIPGRYDVIFKHIAGHKYYLNMDRNEEISFGDSLVSWYKEIYFPIINIIDEENICMSFPGKTKSDLYIYIVKHWDFIKRKSDKELTIVDAALDYKKKYGKEIPFFTRLLLSVKKIYGSRGKAKNKKQNRTAGGSPQ